MYANVRCTCTKDNERMFMYMDVRIPTPDEPHKHARLAGFV